MARKLCLVFSVLLVFCAAAALAEERFGIKVYPGASYDATTSNKLKEAMGVEAACFRTNDSVAKVVTFYKTQPGLKPMGDATNEGAMFRKNKTDVTIQNPWMDMATGKMMTSTLISIVQQKE
jgi:hypothetical protein